MSISVFVNIDVNVCLMFLCNAQMMTIIIEGKLNFNEKKLFSKCVPLTGRYNFNSNDLEC